MAIVAILVVSPAVAAEGLAVLLFPLCRLLLQALDAAVEDYVTSSPLHKKNLSMVTVAERNQIIAEENVLKLLSNEMRAFQRNHPESPGAARFCEECCRATNVKLAPCARCHVRFASKSAREAASARRQTHPSPSPLGGVFLQPGVQDARPVRLPQALLPQAREERALWRGPRRAGHCVDP